MTATAKREPVNMISAIEQRGSIHFTVHQGRCDAAVFIEFCKNLPADAGGIVFLILDNSRIHRAKKTNQFVESTGGRLRLFFRPAYCPQLNPDEWVWKNLKHDRVGRRAMRRPGDLYAAAEQALDRLAAQPGIVRGFFRDPSLAYLQNI